MQCLLSYLQNISAALQCYNTIGKKYRKAATQNTQRVCFLRVSRFRVTKTFITEHIPKFPSTYITAAFKIQSLFVSEG